MQNWKPFNFEFCILNFAFEQRLRGSAQLPGESVSIREVRAQTTVILSRPFVAIAPQDRLRAAKELKLRGTSHMRRILSSFAVYAAQDDGIDAVVEDVNPVVVAV